MGRTESLVCRTASTASAAGQEDETLLTLTDEEGQDTEWSSLLSASSAMDSDGEEPGQQVEFLDSVYFSQQQTSQQHQQSQDRWQEGEEQKCEKEIGDMNSVLPAIAKQQGPTPPSPADGRLTLTTFTASAQEHPAATNNDIRSVSLQPRGSITTAGGSAAVRVDLGLVSPAPTGTSLTRTTTEQFVQSRASLAAATKAVCGAGSEVPVAAGSAQRTSSQEFVTSRASLAALLAPIAARAAADGETTGAFPYNP